MIHQKTTTSKNKTASQNASKTEGITMSAKLTQFNHIFSHFTNFVLAGYFSSRSCIHLGISIYDDDDNLFMDRSIRPLMGNF